MPAVVVPPPVRPKRKAGPTAIPLPEATMALVGEITTKLQAADEQDIRSRRDAGKLIVDILDHPDVHGSLSLDDLRAYVPFERDTLRPCRDLAKKFDDAQFDELLGLRGDRQYRLGWSHFSALTRLPGSFREVKALAVRAVREKMTKLQIVTAVTAAAGGPRSKGGRKSASPKNVADLLAQVKGKAAELHSRASGAWMGDDAPAYTAEIATMAAAERKAIRKAAEAADDAIDVLEGTLRTLRFELERIRQAAASHTPAVPASTNGRVARAG